MLDTSVAKDTSPVGYTLFRIQRDSKTAGIKRCRIQVPKIHALKDTGTARYKHSRMQALKDTIAKGYKRMKNTISRGYHRIQKHYRKPQD